MTLTVGVTTIPCSMQLTEESLLVVIPVKEDPADAFDDQENCAAAANPPAAAPCPAPLEGAGHAAPAGRLLAGRVLRMQASALRGASSLSLTLSQVKLDRLYAATCTGLKDHADGDQL